MTTRRHTWAQARKAVRDAQTSLAHADVKHGTREPMYLAVLARARLALAQCLRDVTTLQRLARLGKARRAA